MSFPLIIRPCETDDIPAITAIYRTEVLERTASFEIEAPDEAEMLRRREAILAAGYPYIVAEDAGTLLGYAYANVFRGRPAYRSTVENSIYISPLAQRRGVGRALLEALIMECEKRDFRQMIGVIGGTDNAASIRLHEALGFTLIGTLPATGYKHGRWLASVLVQKALGAGDTTPPSL